MMAAALGCSKRGQAFERGVERFSLHAAAILLAQGFTVHHRKTRIMRQGVRQHLACFVTQHANVMRPRFGIATKT